MELSRRDILTSIAAAGATQVGARPSAASVAQRTADPFGVLIDLTLHRLPQVRVGLQPGQPPSQPAVQAFEDKSVFAALPPPGRHALHRGEPVPRDASATRPRCTSRRSACTATIRPAPRPASSAPSRSRRSARSPTTRGAAWAAATAWWPARSRCRRYEYDNALTPQVRKCTLCFERISKEGGVPACVEICPPQCLTFGKRTDLLALAHQKIERHPDTYRDHVYGEHEVGGTSWLYWPTVPSGARIPDARRRGAPAPDRVASSTASSSTSFRRSRLVRRVLAGDHEAVRPEARRRSRRAGDGARRGRTGARTPRRVAQATLHAAVVLVLLGLMALGAGAFVGAALRLRASAR